MQSFYRRFTFGLSLLLAASAYAQTSLPSRPAGIDDTLWKRLIEANNLTAQVADLTADFQQQKVTAMLRKPLISSGKIFLRGPVMLWNTIKPEPTVLRIDPREVRLYYPREKTVEVYAITDKLGALAASPIPRLDVLVKYFNFENLDVTVFGESDSRKYLALKLTPIAGGDLDKYIKEVRVLIDTTNGQLARMEMTDIDGDRTIVSFSNVRINSGLTEKDVALEIPADVKIVHPLAGLEPSEPRQ